MTLNNVSTISKLEAERDDLRNQYSQFWDQKQAIEMQMKEIQDRLEDIDERIEGLEQQATEQSEAKMAATKKEPTEDRNHSTMSLTLPEDFLTDPASDGIGLSMTQQHDDADFATAVDPKSGGRVSESPKGNANNHTETEADYKQSSSSADINPFQDLRNNINEFSGTSSSIMGSGNTTTKNNTLERYFVRTEQPSTITEATNPYNRKQPEVARNVYNRHQQTMQQPAQQLAQSSKQQQQQQKQPPWTERVMYHLRQTFNIAQFRGHQHEIIDATLSGQDAFVIMRTGGGKSLTYQLPAVIESESNQRKVTVVISPLISLIRDQEDQMNQMKPGSALSFYSNMVGGTSEQARRWQLVRDPNAGVALIFVTPEKVGKSGRFKSEMEKLNGQARLGRFVIDEAHCACQWGHDFRPDYSQLGILKHHFPKIPVLAVTATASERVRNDCAEILRLGRTYRFFRSTANRPNLTYSIKCKKDSKDAVVKDMVDFINQNHPNQAGIIYTFSKKEADQVADSLCTHGIIARAYHSDVQDTNKTLIHRSWMKNETQVVVATIAFGLGINKPDVRFVLHHSISKSKSSSRCFVQSSCLNN